MTGEVRRSSACVSNCHNAIQCVLRLSRKMTREQEERRLQGWKPEARGTEPGIFSKDEDAGPRRRAPWRPSPGQRRAAWPSLRWAAWRRQVPQNSRDSGGEWARASSQQWRFYFYYFYFLMAVDFVFWRYTTDIFFGWLCCICIKGGFNIIFKLSLAS